jgi:nucleoside-diphosphate-sugar epimerase
VTIKKIATVIGGQGFIGKAIVRHLHKLGWDCWVPDRATSWPLSNRNLGQVFFCAGLTADYLQRPAETVEGHVGLLARVLQSDSYDSLVYLSSTRLYDYLAAGETAHEMACLTLEPHDPRNLFDLSKLTGESLCYAMGRGRARVARLSCVYEGAGNEGFLPMLLRQLEHTPWGSTIQVESSPHFSRDYVHVSDVVQALMNIASNASKLTYNVACERNFTNDELAKFIQEKSGRYIKFMMDDIAPTPALVNMNRYQQEFGWIPTPVQDCIGTWLSALPR